MFPRNEDDFENMLVNKSWVFEKFEGQKEQRNVSKNLLMKKIHVI